MRTSPGYNYYITAADAVRVDDPDSCPCQPGLNECPVCGQSFNALFIEFVRSDDGRMICASHLEKTKSQTERGEM